MSEVKVCLSCGKRKSVEAFPYITRGYPKEGKPRQDICRVCRKRQRSRADYRKHHDRYLDYHKKRWKSTKKTLAKIKEEAAKARLEVKEIKIAVLAELVVYALGLKVEDLGDETWDKLCDTLARSCEVETI